ncbi:MAG: hypothetical protein ACI814_002828 [Mariniblastus sp.]
MSGCESVKPGGKILTRLVDGTVFSRVEKVQKLDET